MVEAYADRWAMITGASSGIGAEFARKLAGRGMHLVLVARRRELMEELAQELDTRHGTNSKIIVSDLSDPSEPKRIFEEISQEGIELELLVNSAGFGFVGEIDGTDLERMLAMIRLNVSALTELTYLFLPGMLARQHGAIINLSSTTGFQPVAHMSVYAATKAYVLHFTESIWAEARDRGVTVMALCPGTTDTNFFDVAGVSGWLKKRRSHPPSKVVRAAMKYLEKRRQYIVPGWGNYFLSLASRFARRKTVVTQSMKYFRPTPKKKKNKSSKEKS